MTKPHWFFLASLAIVISMATAVLADGSAKTATNDISVVRYEWFDAKRNRKVPVKIYFPKDAAKSAPVIIFSHGLGCSRNGYEYLGNYWASHGYVSVHVQHLGSDSAVWQDVAPADRMAAMRPLRSWLHSATSELATFRCSFGAIFLIS